MIKHHCICDSCHKVAEAILDECDKWNAPINWAELLQPNPYKDLGLHLCSNCISDLIKKRDMCENI